MLLPVGGGRGLRVRARRVCARCGFAPVVSLWQGEPAGDVSLLAQRRCKLSAKVVTCRTRRTYQAPGRLVRYVEFLVRVEAGGVGSERALRPDLRDVHVG